MVNENTPLVKVASDLTPRSQDRPCYSLDQIVDLIGFGKFHWQLSFLCGVGYFCEITELVVVSFVAPSIADAWDLNSVQYGLLGSSSFVGMAVGAIVWGWVSDNIGRQISFATTVWLTFTGGMASALSPNYAILLLLRFTAAFGIGGMLPVDYTVFLEFLPSGQRGSKIVLVDAIGVIPALTLSALTSWYFSVAENVEWRWVLAVAAVPVGIMGLLRSHVPESPRYYLSVGETQKAQEVIQKVADMNNVHLPKGWKLLPRTKSCASSLRRSENHKRLHSPDFTEEISQCENANNYCGNIENDDDNLDKKDYHSFADLLSLPFRDITLRLWILYFLVQFSSAGMVFALPKLFEDIFRRSEESDIALDLLVGVAGLFPGLTIAYKIVDWSRTKALAAFFICSGMSVILLGIALHQGNLVYSLVASVLLRGSMEGCYAILNTTAVELYPTVIRTSGLGTAQIFDHIAGALSPLVFSLLHARYPAWVFPLYGGAYMLAALPTLTLPDSARTTVSADI